MPKLIDLYKRLLNVLEKRPRLFGVCRYINDLNNISEQDRIDLLMDFRNKRPSPSRYKEFYLDISFINGVYWWELDWPSHQQRVKFIKHIIKELEDEFKQGVSESTMEI